MDSISSYDDALITDADNLENLKQPVNNYIKIQFKHSSLHTLSNNDNNTLYMHLMIVAHSTFATVRLQKGLETITELNNTWIVVVDQEITSVS